MNNQLFLWGTFIISWMTLFFMPKEDIKRFLPVSFVVTILCIILTEIGISYGWWVVRETTFPLAVIPTYNYGPFPVMAMWVLKYTFGRFRLFLVTDSILNAVLAFIIFPFISSRGIKEFHAGFYIVFIFASAIALISYRYQIWQEDLLVEAEPNTQPTAAKPPSKDQVNKSAPKIQPAMKPLDKENENTRNDDD